MTTALIVKNIFKGDGTPNPAKYVTPTKHRYVVKHHGNGQVFGKELTENEAYALRDLLRLSFGGKYDIIENETVTHMGNRMFSGEVPKNLPHIPSYVPIVDPIDPMSIEYYGWDWEDYFKEEKELSKDFSNQSLDDLPSAPIVRKRKPTRNRNVSREREFSGISDPDILNERGYVVIDLRTQERLFTGTKNLAIEYIEKRNVARSRDRLPIECIKAMKLSDYKAYQETVEKYGKVIRYQGRTILVGLQDEITRALTKMIKKLHNPGKYLSVENAGVTDLWWVQNRVRGE